MLEGVFRAATDARRSFAKKVLIAIPDGFFHPFGNCRGVHGLM
jgi:hypothetical protein